MTFLNDRLVRTVRWLPHHLGHHRNTNVLAKTNSIVRLSSIFSHQSNILQHSICVALVTPDYDRIAGLWSTPSRV